MLQAILNKSKKQHPMKQQLYSHLSPISKTIQVRRTRHAGHNWRIKNEHISNVLLWIPSHGYVHVGQPARTCRQQLLMDLTRAMDDKIGWIDWVWEIRTDRLNNDDAADNGDG